MRAVADMYFYFFKLYYQMVYYLFYPQAIKFGHDEVSFVLLADNRTNVNMEQASNRLTALGAAVCYGNLAVVNAILERGGVDNYVK